MRFTPRVSRLRVFSYQQRIHTTQLRAAARESAVEKQKPVRGQDRGRGAAIPHKITINQRLNEIKWRSEWLRRPTLSRADVGLGGVKRRRAQRASHRQHGSHSFNMVNTPCKVLKDFHREHFTGFVSVVRNR